MVDQVIAHARRDHPDECCGVIAGRDGTATRLFEMDNADRSPTGFTFDSAEWLRVYREIDDADEDQLVVYHSHTATEAYPSRTDVLWSRTTEFQHWLLVSTRAEEDEVRSYVITDGEVVEEELRITPEE
jgi:proteasome lid subunit RPN8/RPN11